jgi:hypothetical protein
MTDIGRAPGTVVGIIVLEDFRRLLVFGQLYQSAIFAEEETERIVGLGFVKLICRQEGIGGRSRTEIEDKMELC